MPKVKDIRDFFHYMFYLIGVKDEPPEFDRFSYKHKMEYGALIAGTILMSTLNCSLAWTHPFRLCR